MKATVYELDIEKINIAKNLLVIQSSLLTSNELFNKKLAFHSSPKQGGGTRKVSIDLLSPKKKEKQREVKKKAECEEKKASMCYN